MDGVDIDVDVSIDTDIDIASDDEIDDADESGGDVLELNFEKEKTLQVDDDSDFE